MKGKIAEQLIPIREFYYQIIKTDGLLFKLCVSFQLIVFWLFNVCM